MRSRRTMGGILAALVLMLLPMLLPAAAAGRGPAEADRADAARSARATGAGQAEPAAPLSGTATLYLPLIARSHSFVPAPPEIFGVHMVFVTEAHGLAEALAARVHWVSSAVAVEWDRVEPVRTSPPTYQWSTVDEVSLINAQQNGLEMIGRIQFTPLWAQKVSGSYCGPIALEALDEFAEFVDAAVRRYSVAPYNVRYWELGNEPDVDPSLVKPREVYGCWGDKTDAYYGGGYYAEMLKVAYPAIKNVDPAAQVLIGGLLLNCNPENPPPGWGCEPSHFLEGVLLAGGGPYFDLLSFHAYTNYAGPGGMTNLGWPGSRTALPEKASFVRSVLEEYGLGERGLILTEGALKCKDPIAECYETQAMYVVESYAQAFSLGLVGHVYYEMINETWNHVGLLYPDRTPKPGFHAYGTMTSFLEGYSYAGVPPDLPPGMEGYTFLSAQTGARTDLLWAVDGALHEVSLPDGAAAYDLYGNAIPVPDVLEVGYSPVYVVRP